MIKAIETRYAGCRFRSRLEARWAVFFDALDLQWEYEPEGFETSRGRYLPDFWLPDFGKWIEVKASAGAIGCREWGLMQDFGNEVAEPESKFSIVFAIPRPRPAVPVVWPTISWVGMGGPIDWAAMDPSDQHLITWGEHAFSVPNRMLVDPAGHVHAGFIPSLWIPSSAKNVADALTAARSVRFEHGEAKA